MMHTRKIRLMMASAALLTLTGPAFALDGADLMKKLDAAMSSNGTTLTFDKAEVSGDTVTASASRSSSRASPATR